MYNAPHRIDPNEMGSQRISMASATTSDNTQRKTLYAQTIPLVYVVARRYFEGGDPEMDVKVTRDLAEAIESYNRLG